MRTPRRKEHDISRHHQWRRHNKEDLPPIEAPTEEREQHCEKRAKNVGRHSPYLLEDDGVARVDCPYDSGEEEGEPLDGDVVEEEDGGYCDGDGAEDTTQKLLLVELVEDGGCAYALGLHACDCEVAFLC